MDNSTYTTKLLQETQEELGPQDILFRSEAAHLVERPTPLTFSLLSGIFSYKGSLGQAYKALDLPVTEFEVSHYLRYLGGRIYFDLRCEDTFLNNAMGMAYVREEGAPVLSKQKGFLKSFTNTLKNMVSNSFILSQYSLHVSFAKERIEELKNLSSTSAPADLAVLRESLTNELQYFYIEYSAVIRLAYLEGLLAKGVSADELDALSTPESTDDLYVTSSKIWLTNSQSLEEVLHTFGNRSFNDFEFSAPRWHETPEVISTLLNKLPKNENNTETRKQESPTSSKHTQLREIIALKDNLRFYLLNRVNSIRQILLSIGKELKLNENIFFLTLEEITQDTKSDLLEMSEEQKKKYETEKVLYIPELITKDSIFSTEKGPNGETLAATPVSTGIVEGMSSIITDPSDNPQPGTILVLPTAGPEYTHLYANALGIIFQSGGVLSHGSIIAREMHIPAVVAQIQQQANLSIRLDATKGLITFLTSQ